MLGPYAGRSRDLLSPRGACGVLVNPNCQASLNFVGVHTFRSWLADPARDAAAAHESAIRAWLPSLGPAMEIDWLRVTLRYKDNHIS